MTQAQKDRFEAIMTEGYVLSSTQCLEDGWRLYRAYFGGFVPYALLLPLVGTLLSLLPLGIGGVLLTVFVLAPIINGGYFIVADRLIHGQAVSFRNFFDSLSHAGGLIINNLLYILLLAVVMMPTYYVAQKSGLAAWYAEVMSTPNIGMDLPEPPNMSSQDSTVLLFNLLPLIYLMVAFSWAYPFLLFFQTGPIAALEYSRRLITRRWFKIFILLLTFFSLMIMISFAAAALMAISPGLANIASFCLFLLLPWVYCSLQAGFVRATYSMRMPEGGEQ